MPTIDKARTAARHQLLLFDNGGIATIAGMKVIPKILGLAVGIVIALWVMAYWDVREADMVCDAGQDPDQQCQQRFIELDRHKHILERNERNPAR